MGTFKKRFNAHNSDFRHSKNRKKTMLSKYVWHLKDNNIPYELSWSILGKAKSFNPVTGVCRLCLLEKYFIMFNSKDATLNSRDELYNPCRHKWRHTLRKAWGPRSSCYFLKILYIYNNISFWYWTSSMYLLPPMSIYVSEDCIGMKQTVIHLD